MSEGDLAFAVYKGELPDPGNPGRTYEAYAFEGFRVRNGQFSEHWDQVKLTRGWMIPPPRQPAAAGGAPQPAASAAAPPPAPVPDPKPGCSTAAATLEANKKLAIASAYRALQPPRTVEFVVAECDYVAIVWKQVLPDPDTPSRSWEHFSFDTFRIANGKVAQHWDNTTR